MSLPGDPISGDALQDRATVWPWRRLTTVPGAVSNFVTDEVTSPSGEQMKREYLEHPGAVAVVALDDADRIAVIAQYRHPVRQRLIEPPAGLLDAPGEDPLDAAKRELAEEVGLAAARWNVLVDLVSSPGCNSESIRIFLARDLTEVGRPEGFLIEGEEAHMELAWADRNELVDQILAGRVQGPTALAGVLALQTVILSGSLDQLRPADVAWPIRSAER